MTENTSISFSQEKKLELAYRFYGKLLLRKEIPLQDDFFQQLISHRYFTPTTSIQKSLFKVRCLRCNNQKRSLFAMFPCYTCDDEHIYCRKCIEMGRVIECEPLYYWTGPSPVYPQIDDPCTWQGKLAHNQLQASQRILKAIHNNEKHLLVWGVCGAGKTEMLFPGLTEAIKQGKRVCIATPRTDVVRELLPRLSKAFTPVEIQGLYGGSKDKDGTAQLIIATTHQLLRFQSTFDVMIIDEIDAFPYHADASLPFATNRAVKETGTTIYLTATPGKEQQDQLQANKLPHIFVPVRYHGHPLPVPTFKMCFSLANSLQSFQPPAAFLSWIEKRNNKHRQFLIFVPTIELAEKLKENLCTILIESKVIQSTEDLESVHAEDEDRAKKVDLFRKKKIFILITTTILERGVTFPSIDVVVLDAGHEVFNEAALVQIAGRAGRSPEDPTGEVVFFHNGKTNAMTQAVQSIISMNKRGGFS